MNRMNAQRLDWSDDRGYQLRHLCEHYGLPLQSMCLSAHRRFPFGSEDPAIRQQAHEIMEKAINLAYKLGIRCIQLAGYDVYYEPQGAATHQRFIEGMKAATKMAERAGVMLGVEIMDTPYLNSLSKFEVLKKADFHHLISRSTPMLAISRAGIMTPAPS